jgi:rod shape-determining protein MreC
MLVAKPFDITNNFLVFFSNFKEIKKLNISLEAENSELIDKVNRNNFLEYENLRLKKLLNINEKNYSKKLIGRILIDPYKNDDFSFVIDLGKKDGLKINDIVFNEYGMIGRVLELGDFSSKVISLYDQDSVIPVFSMETKKSFFVKGSGNNLLIKHFDSPFSLKHNEVLITTKAAGYFKEGIKVGKVKKTLNEVYVEPFAKLSDTIYVYVLVFEFDKILNF